MHIESSVVYEFTSSFFYSTRSTALHLESKLKFFSISHSTLGDSSIFHGYHQDSSLSFSNLEAISNTGSKILKNSTYFCNLFTIYMFCPLNYIGFTFITIFHIKISTCLARSTNFRVFMVSSTLFKDGEIFPIINVKVLAVRES